VVFNKQNALELSQYLTTLFKNKIKKWVDFVQIRFKSHQYEKCYYAEDRLSKSFSLHRQRAVRENEQGSP